MIFRGGGTIEARILIVDDDPGVLAALAQRMKRHRRWEVVCVHSGEDALAELELAPYDVVVSALRMPSMHGAELLRIVAAIYPATARVALTGYLDDGDRETVREHAHAVLYKPCTIAMLTWTIGRLVTIDTDELEDDLTLN